MKDLQLFPGKGVQKLRFILWAVAICFVLLSALVRFPGGIFSVVISLLFLLWCVTYILDGTYHFSDVPLLFLLLGTFTFGRAFSLLGIDIGPLPLYITEGAAVVSLILIFLFKKVPIKEALAKEEAVKIKEAKEGAVKPVSTVVTSSSREKSEASFLRWPLQIIKRKTALLQYWESALPKYLFMPIILYFVIGGIYFILGAVVNRAAAFRDIVYCLYLVFFFMTLSLLDRQEKIERLLRVMLPGMMIVLLFGFLMIFIGLPSATALKQFVRETKMTNLSLSYGLIAVFGLSFFSYSFRKGRKLWFRIVFGAGIYLALLLIILFEVRASWLSIIVLCEALKLFINT